MRPISLGVIPKAAAPTIESSSPAIKRETPAVKHRAAAPPRIRSVRWVQQTLNDRGFDAGPVDGKMGPKTREAIEAFERANGLSIHSFISPKLVAALEAEVDAPARSQTRRSREISSAITPKPSPGPDSKAFDVVPAPRLEAARGGPPTDRTGAPTAAKPIASAAGSKPDMTNPDMTGDPALKPGGFAEFKFILAGVGREIYRQIKQTVLGWVEGEEPARVRRTQSASAD